MDLNKILQIEDPQQYRRELEDLRSKYRGTTLALYVEALVEENALVALDKYKSLASKYPDSQYAPHALLKVAKYYFSKGLYISSRRQFLEVAEKYPRSEVAHEAKYFALASLCATSRDETCQSQLKKFILENPRSPFAVLAKEDLGALRSQPEDFKNPVNGQLLKTNGKYTLQVGAFSQVNNALVLKDYCAGLDLPVEIRESKGQNRTMYLVWLGAFDTEDEARDFGEKFKLEHGKPYRVVPVEHASK